MNYTDILPNWMNYEKLYSEAVTAANPLQTNRFLELGTFLGRSAAFISKEIKASGKDIEFTTVDLFTGPDEKFADLLIGMYQTAINNLSECGADNVIVKKQSTDAFFQSLQQKEIFDFIFIDASHEYSQVKKDIKNAMIALKPGGTLAGHDYNLPGVKSAVDENFKFHELSFFENCWIYKKESSTL